MFNPFRYRGYYYDTDTGLYYLQSRYYNPKWGRFLNADGYVSTGMGLLGHNMYAYCGNNPVMGYDPTGEIAIVDDLLFWGGVALVALVIVVASPIIIDTLEYITEGGYQLASEVIDVIDAIDYVTPPHSITKETLIIATFKIAVTLDNCSKEWYNMSQGDEKNGQNAAQCRVESSC